MIESNTECPHAVVLFDGYCKFCNFWVNFLIKIDRQKQLRFASAQSPTGKSLLERGNIDAIGADSVAVYDEGRFYLRSAAILHIARRLRGIWRLGYAFVIIPRPVRDMIYDFVARNRYRWFGRRETCRVPMETDRDRFLE